MRVALVSPYALDVVGGVQAHVLALAEALIELGTHVDVLGPSAHGPLPDRTAGGAPLHRLGGTRAVPANGSRAPIALHPRSAQRTRAAIGRLRPDVVHIHEPFVPLVGPAAARSNAAVRVLTFHACAEAGALPRIYRAVRAPARRIMRGAQVLTAVSPVAAAFHAAMLGMDADRLEIVPNGVDVGRFAQHAERGTGAASRPLLVFLGRLEPRKGADIAVRAFISLAQQRPDVCLRVLGDGPAAPMLAALVAQAPPEVARRIDLAGRIDPLALPRALAEADVVLLPARGGESFGIVLLEAMAARVPIVATDIPGYRAVARHDREALLVAPDDPAALAAAAARLIDDAALAQRLRAAGALRAAEHDWSAVARRMHALYATAIDGLRAT